MNRQTRLVIDADILGNCDLQERFVAYVEVLGYIVQRAPRPVGMAALETVSNRPAAALKRCCNELCRAGILKRSPGPPPTWTLTKDVSEVTLEDVFRCAVAGGCSKQRRSGESDAPSACDALEVFLMQAMLTVEDHLFKHLRTFSLDRLKASAAAFPVQRPLPASPFAEIS